VKWGVIANELEDQPEGVQFLSLSSREGMIQHAFLVHSSDLLAANKHHPQNQQSSHHKQRAAFARFVVLLR
jgi:hypothetical protein